MSAGSPMATRRAELLSELVAHLTRALQEHGIAAPLAGAAAEFATDQIAEHWGGCVISFPKDVSRINAIRDAEIIRDFDGSNHATLARKHDLTESAIYKILRRAGKGRRSQNA